MSVRRTHETIAKLMKAMELEAEESGMKPPRLQTNTCFTKLMFASCCCCFCFALVVVFGVVTMQIFPQPQTQTIQKRPLSATLYRFSRLKRAASPGRGADTASLASAFPHWRSDGQLVTDAAVNDLALAVSDLTNQLINQHENSALQPKSPQPQSEELLEL